MAEIMMLNNSTSTIQQNPSLSLGKESLKTRGGEAEDLALNFGNFLRASKEENGKEEVAAKGKKKDVEEQPREEKEVKVKTPDEKKAEKKPEEKDMLSEEERADSLALENNFLMQRDQLKVELKTKLEEANGLSGEVKAVEESIRNLPAIEESFKEEGVEKAIASEEDSSKVSLPLNEEKLEEKGEELLKPDSEKKPAVQSEKMEAADTREEKKGSRILKDRIARPDLKKEDLQQMGELKAEKPFKAELSPLPGIEKAENLHLVTKEESITKDVAELLAEKMDFHKGELKIELEPRTLGQITVKVNFIGGKANVVIFAENPKTLHLLQNGAGEMARILEEKTGEITKVIVHEENKGEQFFRDNDSNSKENKNEAERRLREAEEEKNKGNTEEFLHRMRLGLTE